MSRDIKLRAWDVNPETLIGKFIYIDITNGLTPESGRVLNSLEEFQEYTGLKDKNGVEIYEGDILSYHTRIGRDTGDWNQYVDHWVIGYADVVSAFTIKPVYDGDELRDGDKGNLAETPIYELWDGFGVINKDFEVIGNTHQNPELLK